MKTGIWVKMAFILDPFEQVACVGTWDVLNCGFLKHTSVSPWF